MTVAVGVAVDISLDPARNNLDIAVIAIRVLDQRRDQQRLAHHATHQRALGVLRHGISETVVLVGKRIFVRRIRRRQWFSILQRSTRTLAWAIGVIGPVPADLAAFCHNDATLQKERLGVLARLPKSQ